MTLVEEVVHKVKSIIEIPELRKRVVFTLIMFLVARVGVHIQVPGIDVSRLSSAMQGNSLAGFINTFSGGGFQNASMFALGIIPYINSSIIMTTIPDTAIPFSTLILYTFFLSICFILNGIIFEFHQQKKMMFF